jgi:MarR family transcriptional regulator, multiple antibiotic resistance protein MarR
MGSGAAAAQPGMEVRSEMVSKVETSARLSTAEEYELWSLLGQVNDGMLSARDNELRKFGISTVQVSIMYAIRNLGHSPTQSEIARWVARRPHTVAGAVDRMERQGLVRRVRNVGGRKQVRVEITEKGNDLYRQQHRQRRAIPGILGGIAPEERELLRDILRKLRENTLSELSFKPPFP